MANTLSRKGNQLLSNYKDAIRVHDAVGPSMHTLSRYADAYKAIYFYMADLEAAAAEDKIKKERDHYDEHIVNGFSKE